MSDFETILAEARGASTPDSGTPTTDSTPAGSNNAETVTPTPNTSDTTTPNPDPAAGQLEGTVDEKPFNWDELTAQHPDLVPLAKQLQADYTRKTQQLADQRKQFEGVDPESIEGLRALQ